MTLKDLIIEMWAEKGLFDADYSRRVQELNRMIVKIEDLI